MKNTLLLIAVLLVSCATTPTLEEKVAGSYEGSGGRYYLVLLGNGVGESYEGGRGEKVKWEISKDGDLHLREDDREGFVFVYRINPDSSLTVIATIADGRRKEAPKKYQITAKKIILRDRVVGGYGIKPDNNIIDEIILHKNGVFEAYNKGKMAGGESGWKINNNGELMCEYSGGFVDVYRINFRKKSITRIARIEGRKRKELIKENQLTYTKSYFNK